MAEGVRQVWREIRAGVLAGWVVLGRGAAGGKEVSCSAVWGKIRCYIGYEHYLSQFGIRIWTGFFMPVPFPVLNIDIERKGSFRM